MKSAWPEPSELWGTLGVAGLLTLPLTGLPASLDWEDFIETAVSEWDAKFQVATGRARFLAASGTQTFALSQLRGNTSHTDNRLGVSSPFSYPAPAPGWDTLSSWYLPIVTGIVSVSEVRLLVPGGPPDGTLLTANQDYSLTPPEPAPGGHLGEWGRAGLLFPFFAHTDVASIPQGVLRVLGSFGSVTEVPAHIRSLVKNRALLEAVPLLQSAKFHESGGVIGVKRTIEIGPVKTEIGHGSTGSGTSPVFLGDETQRSNIRKQMTKAASRYRTSVFA